jgi:hypothetical protein
MTQTKMSVFECHLTTCLFDPICISELFRVDNKKLLCFCVAPVCQRILGVSEVQVWTPAEGVSAVVSKRNQQKSNHSFKQFHTLNTNGTTNCSFSGSLLLGVEFPVKTLKK